jgi:P4 family phage/plasmid primase-like protien
MDAPRFIGSARPFQDKAYEYVQKGWLWPIPIPARQKSPPPTGYTGKFDEAKGKGLPVTDKVLKKWLNSEKVKDANIAQHLGFEFPITKFEETVNWTLIGIDVDHHPDDDDPKFGGDQLIELEKQLGKLPDTWTSSARSNGIAGIRFYSVPPGLQWRGNCAELGGKHIDIVSVGHKYAVLYPSYHPSAGQYLWYPPGVKPSGPDVLKDIDWRYFGPEFPDDRFREMIGRDICVIPPVHQMRILPDKWIEFLTRGRLVDTGPLPIDMEIGDKDLETWAVKNFAPANQRILEKRTGETTLAQHNGMCYQMRTKLKTYVDKIEHEDASHTVLQESHFSLLNMGAEGHSGWGGAVTELERAWREHVTKLNKRTLSNMNSEIYRSKFGALRKIKGKADEARDQGIDYFAGFDTCYEDDATALPEGTDFPPPSELFDIPKTFADPPNKYDMNDDGNAEHFLDLHKDNLHFVVNVIQKWIIWDGSHWFVDEKGLIKFLYRRVKVRQQNYANKLWADYEKVKGQKGATEIKNKALKWLAHAKSSGMNATIRNALDAAKTVRQESSLKFEQLDNDRRALGSINSILKIDKNGRVEQMENSKDFLITKSTGISYIPLIEQANSNDPDIYRGYELFMDFLNKFIKPSIDLEYFQRLCGSTLLGDIQNKFAIFFWGPPDSGKSTMLNLIVHCLGDYACMRNPDIFKSVHLNPALASALPMRVVGVDELGNNEINSELFKTITGGDIVTCELKGKNNLVSAIPQFTIISTGNDAPNVPGADQAFRNRMCVVEFKHIANDVEKTKGKDVQQELMKYGLTACLAWLIEGCSRSVTNSILPFPDEIALATEEFASKLNDLSPFKNEWIMEDPNGIIRNADMKSHFEDYCQVNNLDVRGWSQTKLTQKLKALGFKQEVRSIPKKDGTGRVSVRVWVGIKRIRGSEENAFLEK